MTKKKKNPEPPKGTNLKASQTRYNEGRPGAFKRMNERLAYSSRNVDQNEANDDFPLNEKSSVSHIRQSSLRDMERKQKGGYYKTTKEQTSRSIKEEDRLLRNRLEIAGMRKHSEFDSVIVNKAKKKSNDNRSSVSGQTLEKAQMRKNIESKKAQMNKPKPVVKATAKPMPKKKGK